MNNKSNKIYQVTKASHEAPLFRYFGIVDEEFMKGTIAKETTIDDEVLAEFDNYEEAKAFFDNCKLPELYRFSVGNISHAKFWSAQIDELDGEEFCGICDRKYSTPEEEEEYSDDEE